MDQVVGEGRCQEGEIGDEENSDGHYADDGKDRAQDLGEWFTEAVGREQEIESDGRRQIADFEVGEEDDAEMDGVNAEGQA